MWVSRIRKEDLTNDVIDRLLFESLNDSGESVDCIIVLGSIKAAEYRVPVAAKVFFREGPKNNVVWRKNKKSFKWKYGRSR